MEDLRAAVSAGAATPLERLLLAEALAQGVRDAIAQGRVGRALNLAEEVRELCNQLGSGEPERLELAAALLALHGQALRDGLTHRATEHLNELRSLGRRAQATEEQRLALVTALAREHWEAARFRYRDRAQLLLQQLRVLALRSEAPEAQRDLLARGLVREIQVESGALGDAKAVDAALQGLRALGGRERATAAQRVAWREGLAAALASAHAEGRREAPELERELSALAHAGDEAAQDALIGARLAGARSALTVTRPRQILALAHEALARAKRDPAGPGLGALATSLSLLRDEKEEGALLVGVAGLVSGPVRALAPAGRCAALVALLRALPPPLTGERLDLFRELAGQIVELAEQGVGVPAAMEVAREVQNAAAEDATLRELLARLFVAIERAPVTGRGAGRRATLLVGSLHHAQRRGFTDLAREQVARLWRLTSRENADEDERSCLAFGLALAHRARLAEGDGPGASKVLGAIEVLAGRPQATAGQVRVLLGALQQALQHAPNDPAATGLRDRASRTQATLQALMRAQDE